MSNEKDPGCLVYIGDYTTQLYREHNKPLYDPYEPTSISWKVGGFFSWLRWFLFLKTRELGKCSERWNEVKASFDV